MGIGTCLRYHVYRTIFRLPVRHKCWFNLSSCGFVHTRSFVIFDRGPLTVGIQTSTGYMNRVYAWNKCRHPPRTRCWIGGRFSHGPTFLEGRSHCQSHSCRTGISGPLVMVTSPTTLDNQTPRYCTGFDGTVPV